MKKLIMIFAGFLLANNLNAWTPEQEIVRAAIEAELIKLQQGVDSGDLESAFTLDDIKQYCSGNRVLISYRAGNILTRDEKTTCDVLKEMLASATQK